MKTFNIDPYKALKSIMEVTSPHLGKTFLKIVCEQLKELFNAHTVFITEALDYNPTTKVKILYKTNPNLPNEFELEGTPCQLVYKGKIIQLKQDVNINFEQEKHTKFQSFYGIPINNQKHQCVGHIAIFSEEQRDIPKEIEDIALIFTRRIETEYERLILEEENKQMLNELYELSINDALTKVYNRRFFTQKGNEVFTQVKRGYVHAFLIFLDLDNFKKLNDEFGHETGDYVLEKLGLIFLEVCRRDIDFTSRIGGEEFAIISLNCQIEDAKKLAQRIMQKTTDFFKDEKYKVTFSVGISSFSKSFETWQEVYSLADKKMYEAKKNGKNQIQI